MAFPILGAQQETNRKILEDLQIKRQLLQKGADITLGTGGLNNLNTPIAQMPTSQILGQPTEFQSSGAITVPRTVFNPTSSTTLGYFVSQDSHYGNSFIPVLPRLDPLPPNHTAK
ncbi:SOSS complex subunit C homolog isoform X1 [Musca vetustissima]|uniref:SOSS complex subunit C homolog isoform X1 n=1 Tax=Musca vetustissima TaxID=27455 RepID=UPI002AB68176|nr:SOSS complex subunit C homolog isoform X1 [Musca vetustissima]